MRLLSMTLALLIALPLPAFAKRICLSDGLRVYVLDVQGTCKAQKPGSPKIKTFAVRGFTQGASCPNTALTGTCISTANGVVLQLIAQTEPNNGCAKFLVYANGAALTSLSGAYDTAPFAGDDGAIAFTQVSCP